MHVNSRNLALNFNGTTMNKEEMPGWNDGWKPHNNRIEVPIISVDGYIQEQPSDVVNIVLKIIAFSIKFYRKKKSILERR